MDLLERAKTRLAWANNLGYPAREGARINLVEEDVPALIAEVETLRRFIDDEVMPRYVEMFDALGLGNPAESVVVTTASALLGKPSR